MKGLAHLRLEVQRRRADVHALEEGGPGEGKIGDPAFAQCQAFDGVLKLIDALVPDGTDLIANERHRQRAKGHDAEHDQKHGATEIVMAAGAYVTATLHRRFGSPAPSAEDAAWPWADGFSPTTDLCDLVKAGALIAAAIDVLLAEAGAR